MPENKDNEQAESKDVRKIVVRPDETVVVYE